MKLAIVTNAVPFVAGGAEQLAASLRSALVRHGHEAIVVRYPFTWHPPEKVLQSMLACSMMRFPNVDRVIGLKFPAYLVPHHDKILWLLHQFRQAYDMWGTALQDLPNDVEGYRVRAAVHTADNMLLRKVQQVYTISEVVSARMKRYNEISSTVLYHPLPVDPVYSSITYGDFVFCPSRMTSAKRQLLLIEAMRHTRTAVRLVLAGVTEPPYTVEALKAAALATGRADRITLMPEYIGDAQKFALIEGALAAAYIPVDEDSYGYVTLEHARARKAVVTCTDSGGTQILVKDQETGRVVEPNPAALAEAFDALYADRRAALRMGEAAFALQSSLDIAWDNVVAKLTR